MDSKELNNILTFDPLAAAEALTEKSYKDDEETMALGALMHLRRRVRKQELLESMNDSTYNTGFEAYLDILKDLGFQVAYTKRFHGHVYCESCVETYHILWHPDGILATAESYNENRLNTANMYYNYRHTADGSAWDVGSSGSINADGVLIGNHDIRESVRFKIDRMRERGEFLPKWVEQPFLWFSTYMDTKEEGYDIDAINERVIADLPKHVREAIDVPKCL